MKKILQPSLIGGVCHHEIGNLIIYNTIVWSLVIILSIGVVNAKSITRVITVEGVNRSYVVQPYFGAASPKAITK